MTARTFTFLISQYGVIGITRGKAREGLQMIWGPHLVAVMRVFLVILAIMFVASGTAMLVLTFPLGLPWYVHTDIAARYAVVFLSIAAVCAWGATGFGKN